MSVDPEALVERIRATPRTPGGDRRLVGMLRRDGAAYRGLSTADAEWVRGHVLAAFQHRRAPPVVVAAVREELRTSLNPTVLAGAARVVRGLPDADAWAPLLDAAAGRLSIGDQYVDLGDAVGPRRTAKEELALTPDGQATAHCCHAAAVTGENTVRLSLCPGALSPVIVEDQAGAQALLLDLLRARPSVVAFFYTRCMNPSKCSLTVTRLAGVAARLGAAGNVLALSYDGDFDTPPRLAAFGSDRGFPFGDTARLARCTAGWAALKRQFALDVGYGETTVNAHGREVFLISPDLTAEAVDPELLVSPEDVAERVLPSGSAQTSSAG
jgi:cytochrome oxidase Cu insertion factor (SCO1/SenC/PrrC family)